MSDRQKTILYVGGFRLPDKNAAAQRVIANAAALSELGYRVLFVIQNADCKEETRTEYFGFACCDYPPEGMLRELTSIKHIKRIMAEEEVFAVIAYNYPAVAFSKLLRYCKKRGVRCYADATEWYHPKGNPIHRIVKTLDTEWRMKRLQKKTDGVIAISAFLYDYYKDSVHTVKIPPLVDLQQQKWQDLCTEKGNDGIQRFVYCGSPSAQKECLDVIVQAIETLQVDTPVKLTVIGVTQAQFESMYQTSYRGDRTEFLGRLSHKESLFHIAKSDWSIIIRENNPVVRAGFPTKLCESISCGTPVIINRFSNVEDYINDSNGILCEADKLEQALQKACSTVCRVKRDQFDCRNFKEEFTALINHSST